MIDLTVPAAFSDCGTYRWFLRRDIGMYGPILVSCGYNPSRACAVENDHTIFREIKLCKTLGYSTLFKVNGFSAVSTDPNGLVDMDDPIGALTDPYLRAAISMALGTGGIALATWGAPKGRLATRKLAAKRFADVLQMADWHALRITKSGHPEHPARLPNGLVPTLLPKEAA